MNRKFDRCEKCQSFEYLDKQKNGWIGYCKIYQIKRMPESESCDKLIPVEDSEQLTGGHAKVFGDIDSTFFE